MEITRLHQGSHVNGLSHNFAKRRNPSCNCTFMAEPDKTRRGEDCGRDLKDFFPQWCQKKKRNEIKTPLSYSDRRLNISMEQIFLWYCSAKDGFIPFRQVWPQWCKVTKRMNLTEWFSYKKIICITSLTGACSRNSGIPFYVGLMSCIFV